MVENVATPVEIGQLAKFERDNVHLRLRLSVLFCEGPDVYPVYISKNNIPTATTATLPSSPPAADVRRICLALHQKVLPSSNDRIFSHYCLVDDINVFLRQIHDRDERGQETLRYRNRCFYCPSCLTRFSRQHVLDQHQVLCLQNKTQAVVMMPEGSKIVFENYNSRFPAEYVGFFDFEAVCPPKLTPCNTCQGDQRRCRCLTKIVSIQEVVTFALVLVDSDHRVVHHRTYTGEDAIDVFLAHLVRLEKKLALALNRHPLCPSLTPGQMQDFDSADTCHICQLTFRDDDVKVRDHNHRTGLYLGPAHNDW